MRLQDVIDRACGGYPLTPAEGRTLRDAVAALQTPPEVRLVALVGDIGGRIATATERSDQAHRRADEAHDAQSQAMARVEPVLVELATEKARALRLDNDERAARIAAAGKFSERALEIVTATVKASWFQSLIAALVGATLTALGVSWTAP